MTLTIGVVDPQHPQALHLLAEAALDARALYPDLIAADAPMPTNAPALPGSVYLLAWAGDAALGCGALRPLEQGVAEVRRMFVQAAARRQGVARAVLAELEVHARALGYGCLKLETGHRQTPAMALYQACGYRPIEPFGEHVGDPTSRCFEKRIAP